MFPEILKMFIQRCLQNQESSIDVGFFYVKDSDCLEMSIWLSESQSIFDVL